MQGLIATMTLSLFLWLVNELQSQHRIQRCHNQARAEGRCEMGRLTGSASSQLHAASARDDIGGEHVEATAFKEMPGLEWGR